MPPTAPFENDAVRRIVYLNFAAVLGRKKGTLANGWHACAALAEILNWGGESPCMERDPFCCPPAKSTVARMVRPAR